MISIVPTKQVKEILRDPATGQPMSMVDRGLRKTIFKQVIEYGFYANDLIKAYEELVDEMGEVSYFNPQDLALLIPDSRSNA